MSFIMDPAQRRWWRLLDTLPERIGTVRRWVGEFPPTAAEGSLHANPTAVVCLEGVVRLWRSGETIDLRPGEALLIAPGIWHRHEPLRRDSVWFGQGFLPAWSDVILGDSRQSWTGKLPSQPSRRLMDAALATRDGDQRQQLFADLVRQVLAESVTNQSFANPALQRMVARLWNGLHLGLTVADLVRASGLSRAQAYRLFTVGYGVAPKEAIEMTRLWLAEGLLKGEASVAEIARRSGYPSAVTFARAWRRIHGRSPRQHRLN